MDFQISTHKQFVPEAEYRPVAVLWLNLDPLDVQSQIRPSAIARLIMDFAQTAKRNGGVVSLRRDGLTAVFGIPVVAENDVVQAVLAAYQINQKSLPESESLVIPTHIGISYDFVTLNQIQDGASITIQILGDALAQAEKLAAVSTKTKIYVTSKVRNATTHYFSYEEALKLPDWQEASWVLGAPLDAPGSSRGLPSIHTRYIGRAHSLNAMLSLAKNMESGLGGIIWIEGEAGIGKSRLMREFETAVTLPTMPFIWKGSSSAHRTDQAFSLFAAVFANTFNIQTTDTAAQMRQKIKDGINKWPRDAQNTQPYLEIIMGLEPTDPHFVKMQPEQLRQQIFVAIRRLLKTLVKEHPIILFLDDLHWIDPISAELLLFIATIVASDAILFVCAQRLQGAESPNDRLLRLQSLLPGQTKQMFLEKLSKKDSLQLLNELLPTTKLPDEFYELTISRSEGNPYFIEELVRMSIEQAYLQKENGWWQLNVPVAHLSDMIPMSLNSLIYARIDALPGDLKQIVQYAAVIGFQFDAAILQTIATVSNIEQPLQRLANRLVVSRLNTSAQWQFNHTLFHAIVYQSIPATHRQKLHKRIALALETQQADENVEYAAALAFHFSQAEAYIRAIPYAILAGEKSASHYANEEAVSHFQQAERYLTYLSEPNPEWQWRLGIGLGEAYRIMGLFDESIRALETLVPLAQTNPEYPYVRLLILLGKTARKLGNYDKGRTYLTQAKELLGESLSEDRPQEICQVFTELAWIYFAQGEFEQARKIGTEGLEFAKQLGDLNEMADAENLLGGIGYQSGDWQQAMHHTTRAMVFREQMGYSWAVARSYSNLGVLAYVIGHWPKAIDYFKHSLSLRQEMGDVEGVAITHNNLGHPYRGQGKFELAEMHYQESLKIAKLFNISSMIVNASSGLAQIYLWQEKYDEAEETITTNILLAESIGAKDVLAELLRIQAEFSFAKQDYQSALEQANDALKLSVDIGNKIYEAGACRVASQACFNMDDLEGASAFLEMGQNALTGITDELGKGRLMVQSYRINMALGNKAAAMADYAVAHSIFMRLGAMHHLEKLESLPQWF
ncbi:MAG: tetratricopeptide repeat protein [Anaerolineae bacterium]|nr:tetratricopeptide repeat protein [Anaerolineae bacterium]